MWKRLLTGLAGTVYVAVLVVAEGKQPLRRGRRESKLVRQLRNLSLAGLGSLTLQLLEDPLVRPLAKRVQQRRWGLLQQRRLPPAIEVVAGVLLLDYTLYLWHVLTHRVPLLWRFHAAHHMDLDMDASTAIRFHFGELALSVPYRAAQVLLFGITPRTLGVWQAFTFASILFHHSNLGLSPELDRRLQMIWVTPRLHGIHHSAVPGETNSNWSSGLTIWDRLHRTFRCDVSQSTITIGVAGLDQPRQVTFRRTLQMPFTPPPAVPHFLEAADRSRGPRNGHCKAKNIAAASASATKI